MPNKKPIITLLIFIAIALWFPLPKAQDTVVIGMPKILTTTTLLADLAQNICGDRYQVESLIGPDSDPHLYQASAGDLMRLHQADIVIYHGMSLEGKMESVFAAIKASGIPVICIEDAFSEEELLTAADQNTVYDPHIWFDVRLWCKAGAYLSDFLSAHDEEGSKLFQRNYAAYQHRLEALDKQLYAKVETIPQSQRILITAHDAFRYLGARYGLDVIGLQGIATNTEASVSDISVLADHITKNKIKAIFFESTVAPKTIEALQAAVTARGFHVAIGGKLYTDSLGANLTYLQTLLYNIDTITHGLTGS